MGGFFYVPFFKHTGLGFYPILDWCFITQEKPKIIELVPVVVFQSSTFANGHASVSAATKMTSKILWFLLRPTQFISGKLLWLTKLVLTQT